MPQEEPLQEPLQPLRTHRCKLDKRDFSSIDFRSRLLFSKFGTCKFKKKTINRNVIFLSRLNFCYVPTVRSVDVIGWFLYWCYLYTRNGNKLRKESLSRNHSLDFDPANRTINDCYTSYTCNIEYILTHYKIEGVLPLYLWRLSLLGYNPPFAQPTKIYIIKYAMAFGIEIAGRRILIYHLWMECIRCQTTTVDKPHLAPFKS